MHFMYGTAAGRFILKPVTAPLLSRAAGGLLSSRLSAVFVRGFVRRNKIDMSQYEDRKYLSFNDFFTRRILPERRRVCMEPEALVSPCDGRLTVYRIDEAAELVIKGVPYNVRELLRDGELAARFAGGLALVFRLCVDDYHRYCWFDGGEAERAVHIPGVLNTVRPVALRSVPVFRENSREYTLLHSESFGDAIQMEVGATMVGRIANLPHAGTVRRGEEKGMFMFGGSTVVLLLRQGAAELEAELLRQTAGETEVVVKMGQRIGSRARRDMGE